MKKISPETHPVGTRVMFKKSWRDIEGFTHDQEVVIMRWFGWQRGVSANCQSVVIAASGVSAQVQIRDLRGVA